MGLDQCSPYTYSTINIYLVNQDHYILNKDYSSIARTGIDFSQLVNINITPLYCNVLNNVSACIASGNLLNVYNRVNDYSLFNVYNNLIFTGINFDSLDTLYSTYNVTYTRSRLCTSTSDTACTARLLTYE